VTIPELAGGLGIGLVAGLLGGLAGVGGSMVMLPGLHMVFGDRPASIHHVYMAAAMTVNIAVAVPASIRHRSSQRVGAALFWPLLSSTIAFMILGVLLSDRFAGTALRLVLAGFIVCYCVFNIWRLVRHQEERTAGRPTPGRLLSAGAATGLVGGLLGLGGGVLLVPLLQLVCRLPLRQSIATSSSVIAVSAVFGAGLKLSTLSQHGHAPREALWLALAMAPTAILGAQLGAGLTHRLPLRAVRLVITVLLLLAAGKLVGL